MNIEDTGEKITAYIATKSNGVMLPFVSVEQCGHKDVFIYDTPANIAKLVIDIIQGKEYVWTHGRIMPYMEQTEIQSRRDSYAALLDYFCDNEIRWNQEAILHILTEMKKAIAQGQVADRWADLLCTALKCVADRKTELTAALNKAQTIDELDDVSANIADNKFTPPEIQQYRKFKWPQK